MATINLSIPDDLKQKMDGLKSVNWSAVARDAFIAKVTIEQLKETDVEQAAIERLRVSKAADADQERAEGIKDGQEWALHTADYGELQRVVSDSGFAADREARRYSEHLAVLCSGLLEEQYTEMDIDSYRESMFGDRYFTVAYLEGFVEGARKIYNKV